MIAPLRYGECYCHVKVGICLDILPALKGGVLAL